MTISIALASTGAYLYFKNAKEHKQEAIRHRLSRKLKHHFDNNEMYGYWIDFSANENGEYLGGINILNDDNQSIDSYSFNYNPKNNSIRDVELLKRQEIS